VVGDTLAAGQVERPAVTPSATAGVSRSFPIRICPLARVPIDNAWQGGPAATCFAMRSGVPSPRPTRSDRPVLVDANNHIAANFDRRWGFVPATADARPSWSRSRLSVAELA
jgi:hypothetical protein